MRAMRPMRLTLAVAIAASLFVGAAFVFGGLACIDAIEPDGKIVSLQGGATLDAAQGLMAQDPPAACTDAGKPGNPCMAAGTCCGSAQGIEICALDGGTNGTCITPPALHTVNTWTALYADYFGGTGRAACSGDGNCHGSASQPGAIASNGYVCPPDDSDGCYTTITSSGAALIQSGLSFQDDALYLYLRKPDSLEGTTLNNMPLAPTELYVFTPADLDRISAWIDAGAPNN
jgi:hypothetical protein